MYLNEHITYYPVAVTNDESRNFNIIAAHQWSKLRFSDLNYLKEKLYSTSFKSKLKFYMTFSSIAIHIIELTFGSISSAYI